MDATPAGATHGRGARTALLNGPSGGASFAVALAVATGTTSDGRPLAVLVHETLTAQGSYAVQLASVALQFLRLSCEYVP